MGNFDAFVDEDDDTPVAPPPVFVPMQASAPVPTHAPAPAPIPIRAVPPPAQVQPAAPARVQPTAPAPAALGMLDLLAMCRLKSSDAQLHALKVTYMKLNVRRTTPALVSVRRARGFSPPISNESHVEVDRRPRADARRERARDAPRRDSHGARRTRRPD